MVKPVTLILSDDEFLASEALASLRDDLEKQGYAVEEPQGEQALFYALETLSLFGGGRLVLVRDGGALDAAALKRVAGWAGPGAPDGVRLAIVAPRSAGAKLRKALGDGAEIVEAVAPPPWEVAKWIVGHVKRRKRQITPDGAQALVDALGTDLRELVTACEQLMTATPGPIDAAVVSRQFHGAESQVWTWVDSVLDRNRTAALRHLNALLSQGENAIGLLAALARQFRTVAAVHGGNDRRPAGAIAKELGVREGAVKRALRQARGFDADGVRRAFRLMADADLALKGGMDGEGEPPDMVLEMLVAAITGERAGAR